MSRAGYQLLGFVVWKGAKWYVRRTYGRYLPTRWRRSGLVGASGRGPALPRRRRRPR